MSKSTAAFGKSSRAKTPTKVSADFAKSLGKSSGSNSLRKSTGNLGASFSSTSGKNAGDLEKIEGEYIKNLQQQIYFLELEANYLREQVRKATDMQPRMTSEAEHMLQKLREMQGEVDGLQSELQRQESHNDIVRNEKELFVNKLRAEQEAHQRDKRLLLEEIVQLKKQLELQERDSNRKDGQILQARGELDKSIAAVRSADTQIQMLQNQVDQKTEQYKLALGALDEKRSELLKSETRLRDVEEKYFSSTASIQDKVVPELREEVRSLRQRLKETEMNADQDRYLRSKLSEDSSHLVQENALLNQQVTELQKQLEREKALREANDSRRSQTIADLVSKTEKEKQLQFELDQSVEELKREQARVSQLMSKLSKQEQLNAASELGMSATRSKVSELESAYQVRDAENVELRRDKMLLVDHVAELQTQLEEKDIEIRNIRSQLYGTEKRLTDMEKLKTLESSVHSQKWDEFSRLADSMKKLSHTMAHSQPATLTARSSAQLDLS